MTTISSRLLLSPLDREFFRYLFVTKGAMIEQINRDVYGYQRPKSLYERIKKFESLGLIEETPHCLHRRRKVVSLTAQGFRKFVTNGDEKRIELRSQAPHHDIRLVDIRAELRRSHLVAEYVTENELQSAKCYEEDPSWSSFVYVHCDGALCAQLSAGKAYLAVEYEAQRKTKDRYRKLLKKYYAEADIPAVLYVGADQSILNVVKQVEAEVDADYRKVFYTPLPDLLTGPVLEFQNIAGKVLSLGEKRALEINWNSPIRENAF